MTITTDVSDTTDLTALLLVCSLKRSPAPSSSEKLGREVLAGLAEHGVRGDVVRIVDHDVRFGVSADEGDGDAWPGIREQVLAADILVLATPIWMGQPSSVAKLVCERLDNEIAETDDEGRPVLVGKVAVVAVVGNEDGAHHTSAELFQALNDVGYTIPAQGVTYWTGEAMQSTDYNDLDPSPEATQGTTATVARNAVHAAQLLRTNYPVG
ncbi:NAD(P)H-dependent oxidoreductase [Nocardioides marinquilinus]|uniref:NAD(P)H-dependent oxidoreductase n=1 Tax=Nocardioides marinquilinus TaxID=1210400 RepID=A0ABP9PBZ8_9ACTN